MTRAEPSPSGTVLAAGAICWRPARAGGLEVLLVRSARWDEWSWPKGKLEPGESLPVCAVREVAEETGVQIELGVPLPSVGYVLPDGRAKTVSYWVGRVRDESIATASPEEIADVVWLPTDQARSRLTRPTDFPPLDALLELAGRRGHETRPLLVVRHAKARSRASWEGEEATRPLTDSGRRQAAALAGLLTAWRPPRALTSPWARCVQTLQPYVDDAPHLAPESFPLLSEQGARNDPAGVVLTITELIRAGDGTLVCTHRPVLEGVVGAIAREATDQVRGALPLRDPWLSPAEVLVAHVAAGRVTHIERHLARSPRNRHHRNDNRS